FFQAEDGIRDGHVTGVQTCALPISGCQPPPGWAAVHRGPSARVGRPVAAVEDDTLLAFAPVATRDSTTWFGPRFMDFAVATPDKIGRASCRERVYIWGAGGGRNKNR